MNKTAPSIEEQEERKKDEKTSFSCTQNSAPVSVKLDRRREEERLKPFQFKPRVSGNPGGRPKVDLAAEIARAIFANDGPAIYATFRKILRKGSPYAFQVLSDRAFGKPKETHQVDISRYKDLSDEDLTKQIKQLEAAGLFKA